MAEAEAAYDQKPGENPEEPDCPPPPPETSGCEPGVDDLRCVAAGDKAKAAYHDTFEAALTQAKVDYEATRKAYRAEQHDATSAVEKLEHDSCRQVERIKCKIEQRRIWKCLDDAFCAVLDELKCCPHPDSGCDEPCDYPLDDIEQKTVAELSVLIKTYQDRTDAAQQSFTALLGEPAALKARVEARRTEVDAITTDLENDKVPVDLKRLYARALVAQWQIKQVWGPFGHTQRFVDCLCQTLTCWTKGCEAVYKLTGALAVAQCQEQAKLDRCEKLRTETVEQVLAAYDRMCATPPCGAEPSDGDDGEDGDSGSGDDTSDESDYGCECGCEEHRHDDCGCEHHHQGCGCHHHRHHHHRHHHHGHDDHGHDDHGHQDHGCGCGCGCD
jgi:hypothetical protein